MQRKRGDDHTAQSTIALLPSWQGSLVGLQQQQYTQDIRSTINGMCASTEEWRYMLRLVAGQSLDHL